VGDPFTGHRGPVNAVAVAEVDGRPIAVSGGDDKTVRVWDLTADTLVGDPFTGHGGPVNTVTSQIRRSLIPRGSPSYVGFGARNIATITAICREGNGKLRWEQIAAPEVRSNILALALTPKRVIAVAAELGIVVFDLPGNSHTTL